MSQTSAERFAPSLTVRHWCEQLGLEARLERAISFSPQRLEGVWQIPVVWNGRLRNSAGRAMWRQSLGGTSFVLELHPGLKQSLDSDLQETFLHEVAHLMAFLEWGIPAGLGHGPVWLEAMIRLGETPWFKRFHSIKECQQPAALAQTVQTEEDLGL